MKPDPRIRKDGKCHVCKKPRTPKIGKSGTTSKHGDPTYLAGRELDPFCSTECCRAYHGQVIPVSRKGTAGRNTGRAPFPHGTVEGYRLCACELCCQAMKDSKAKATG